jgi:membrane-bound lytic murein transglycosylase D
VKRLSPFLFLLFVSCATAAQAPSRSSAGWDIANLPHWRVDHWVEQFSRGEKRDEFASYLERKKQYEELISGELRERHMPQDLIYLAMIESGFNPQAASLQSARGIWQLMPDTARRYKLRVDETVDERLDPEKSTAAALEYLRDLYGRFGSWYLAAAAYNAGENRVGRVLTEAIGSEFGKDEDYYRVWDQLPGETRDFVPAMVAAATIAKDPERYGF